MLETNIKINNLEKIIVPHNVGLGDKKSGGEIARTWADNIGGTSVRESRPGTMGELAIERLDDMGLDESRIDFCKIDVEGFEVKTLSGMRKTIERYKPVVFIEVFDETMPGTGMTAAELKANDTAVRKFFEGLGYEAPVSIPECNYLFVPRK
jgi:FkbM family methyltransferase